MLERVSCNETMIWQDPILGALEIPPISDFEQIDGNDIDKTGLGKRCSNALKKYCRGPGPRVSQKPALKDRCS